MVANDSFRRKSQDALSATNADEVELEAIRLGSAAVDTGIYDEEMAGALDPYESTSSEMLADWAEQDTTEESAVSDITLELQRRWKMLGPSWPFVFNGNSICYEPSRTLVYELCLVIRFAPSLTQSPFNRLPAAFEEVSELTMRRFLGNNSAGLRIGYSSSDSPQIRFRSHVDQLHQLTGEWIWAPDGSRPTDPTLREVKDCGIDFVNWKQFPDGRPGMLMFVGQCACGQNWESKFQDVDSEFRRLCQWVREPSIVRMNRIFSLPVHIANSVTFEEANRLGGLVLDRARLAIAAEKYWEPSDTVKDAQKLIDLVLKQNMA